MAGNKDPLHRALASHPYGMVWCDVGMLPIAFGFCPNAVAWFLEMQRWKGVENLPYPQNDGRMTPLYNENGGIDAIIVTMHERINERNADGGIALLVHEATHIKQYIMKHIGERKPSKEFEAYLMHHIMLELLKAYRQTRGKSNVNRDT